MMVSFTTVFLAVLAATITPVFSQVFFFGPCPDFPVVRKLKLDRFAGKWYEQQRYFSLLEDIPGGKCATVTFTDLGNNTLGVQNNIISASFLRLSKGLVGEAKFLQDDGKDAKFTLNLPGNPFFTLKAYWVLETDYRSLAIVWSCQNYHLFSLQYLWLLTREQKASESVIKRILDEIEILGLSKRHLRKTDQINCPAGI